MNDIVNLKELSILEKVSQEEIFEYIFKEKIYLNKKYKSIFRIDLQPACYFKWYNNILYFVDWGADPSHLTCFMAFSAIEKIEMWEVYLRLNKLIKKEEIGIGEYQVNCPKISNQEKTKISYKERTSGFNANDLKYWKQYEITEDNLIEDNIKVLDYIRFQKEGMIYKKDVINQLAYLIPVNNHFKFYFPENTEFRFLGNTTKNDVGNLQNLENKTIVITKSYKDARVLRNYNINTIWFQNEGMLPSTEILVEILNKNNKIIIWYDNDNAGKIASEKIKNKILKIFNAEITLFFCTVHKDPSDTLKENKELFKKEITKLKKLL